MQKKVTVVCYTFPPMPGVGGRKWAKYSAFLKRMGWEVTVISAKPNPGDFSPWTSDTEGIEKLELDRNYPEILGKVPKNFREKLSYRWQLFWMKKRTKSNYYDRAVFWEPALTKALTSLFEDQEKQILAVSGAPFSLLYYGAKWKEQHPFIRYIADIRDAWLHDAYFGFGGLSEDRKEEERRRLKYVLQMADAVLVPNTEIKEMCLEQDSAAAPKIVILPHAVDQRWIQTKRETHKDAMQILYFGSIFQDLETMVQALAEQIYESKGKLELKIYSSDKKYRQIFQKYGLLENAVQYYEPVDQQMVFEKLAQSAVAIIFVPAAFKDFMVTKFMEIVASRTPIIAIGHKGEVSRMIQEHRLGIFLDANHLETFKNLYDQLQNLDYNSEFDFSEYTFEKQTETLEKIFLNEV